MELGLSFRSAINISSRDVMGPSLFTSPLASFQPSAVGSNFYEALTEGRPQIEIPIIHKRSVDVSKSANLQQNDLTSNEALRGQITQTKNAFRDTMEAAKAEARQAVMETAQGMGMNGGHVAAALFPGRPCDAVNFAMAIDPLFATAIWSAVNDAISQVPNSKIAEVLDKAMEKLQEASRSRDGKAPQSQFNWDKFDTSDLQSFLKADPLKDDNTGRRILAAEQAVLEMKHNRENLEENYTCTGDVYEKVKNELDKGLTDMGLVAEMIDVQKSAAECSMLADALPEVKGLALEKAEIPEFDGIEDVKKQLAAAAPEPEPDPVPDWLKRKMQDLAGLNPFRTAA